MPKTHISFLDIFLSLGPWKIKAIKFIDLVCGSLISSLLKDKPPRDLNRSTIKNILVIRPGGIGDAVFLLPILRQLKKEQPSIAICVLCEKRNKEIFQSQSGLISEVFLLDSYQSLQRAMKGEFDVVIDSEQWHYLSAVIAYFIKAKHTIGFATRPKRAKLFNERVFYEMNGYELDNFQKLFKNVLKPRSDAVSVDASFCVSDELKNWAKNKVPQKSISFFLGASIPLRRLDQGQCEDIIKDALQKKFQVLLIGGKDVIAAGLSLKNKFPESSVINYVGQTNLSQSAALIQQTKLFIGPDSGLMHLACAVGTPVIAIFGPGNLNKWKPIGGKHHVVTENVSCSPCTHFGYTIPTCKGKYVCLREIKINKITNCLTD